MGRIIFSRSEACLETANQHNETAVLNKLCGNPQEILSNKLPAEVGLVGI